tara:strand:+ start:1195 stop:1371 length:177 start_codon:yes stop_codon:yes gene_type:complete
MKPKVTKVMLSRNLPLVINKSSYKIYKYNKFYKDIFIIKAGSIKKILLRELIFKNKPL